MGTYGNKMNQKIECQNGYIGILEKVTEKSGQEYDGWRSIYVGHPGLIMEFDITGKEECGFLVFLPADLPGKYLQTSKGKVTIDEGKIVAETKNSRYEFILDDKCVPQEKLPYLLQNAEFFLMRGKSEEELRQEHDRQFDELNEKYGIKEEL